MKSKKIEKKLSLNKTTVASLDLTDMKTLHGGNCPPPTLDGGDETCGPEDCSLECPPTTD